MAYAVMLEKVECWFAAFNRQEEWKLQTTKGVARDMLEGWLKKSAR